MLKVTYHLLELGIVVILSAACATQSASTAVPATNTPGTPAAPSPAPTLAPATPESASASIAAAEKLLDQFVQQDYAAMIDSFDAAMKAALPEDKLKQAWDGVNQQFGAYQGKTKSQFVGRIDKYDVALITVKFEKGALGFRVSVDTTSGQIGGLQFVPVDSAQSTPYTVPAYVDQSKFEEKDVTIGSGEWQLPGTLTLPRIGGPFAAVVLVHGSGPNDRDETIGPNKPFKDLAWGLASQGIAVLRYDKRTKVHAEKSAALKDFTVQEETVDDAVAAVELLQQTPGVDPQRIFVLGHSLGGYLAPRIAQADTTIAGLIILAGLTRPLEDAMLEQVQYIASISGTSVPTSTLTDLQTQIDAVKALRPGDEAKPAILGAPPAYWIDLQNYRPAELAKSIAKPMLILQGERDYQVTMQDFKNWQTALSSRSDVQFKSYPDLYHLFISGTGKSTPAEYQQPGHVAAIVIDDIAVWVKSK